MATQKSHFLIALPIFRGSKGFCHPTILVFATNEREAISIAKHIKPFDNIGDVKKVDYSQGKSK